LIFVYCEKLSERSYIYMYMEDNTYMIWERK